MRKIALLPLILPLPSLAQNQPVEDESAQPEIVTVTAQKRRENLIAVPISMTNIGAETIAQTGVQQLKDVAQYIPNFTMSDGTSFASSVSIRGVGANSRNIGFDTRVGVYLDGVYLGQSPALNQALLDLERIEVLRGPQGTLFGKNTVAGAVNLISAKPAEEFTGTINTSWGNFNAREVSTSLDFALSDNLFTKISLSKQQRDGITENLATDNMINELDDTSYRAQFLYLADNENFEARLAIDGLKGDRLSYTGEAVTDTFGATIPSTDTEEFQVSMEVDPYEKRDVDGISLTLDWKLDNQFAFRSITANRDTKIDYINDLDYSSVDLFTINYRDEYQQFSQELQLISPDVGDLKYIVGLYYFNQDAFSDRNVIAGPIGQVAFGISAPATSKGTVDTISYASFMNGSYQLTNDWKLGFGLRYSIEEKDVDWNINGSGAPAFGIATGTMIDSRKDEHLAPTVNVNYAFSKNLHAYAKYSNGYKSGGYNLDFVSINTFESGIEFDKEIVNSYELGFKGNILNHSLRFSMAAFQTYYDDYQVNQFQDLGNGATAISIRNAAEVETKGLEIEATFNPNKRWELNAALGLLDGEFTNFPGGSAGGEDASGKTIPGISDVSFSLGAQYYFPVPSLEAELLLRVDYSYRSDYYTSVDNTKTSPLSNGDSVQFGWIDNLNIINTRLGLLSDERTWDIAIWVKNFTDESYLTNTQRDFLGTITHYRGLPRTYGIEVNYNF